MARGIRRSDKRIKSPARLTRMKAAYEAAWPTFKSCQIWSFVTPDFAAEIEAERDLYAKRPSLSAVVAQLLEEGLAFRKMHRAPVRPPRRKRVPYPIDI
jgi:hypothetical protein